MGLSSSLSGWTVAIFEVAGCFGMIVAGLVSDKLFKSQSQRVCAIEMALVAVCMVALHFIQDMNSPVLFLIVLALAGFFLYGPQALLGVIASTGSEGSTPRWNYDCELSQHPRTGYPLGKFTDTFGWHPIFLLMTIVALISTLTIAVLWNRKIAVS